MARRLRVALLFSLLVALWMLAAGRAEARCITTGFNGIGTTQCIPV